jgi:hypothetical protein
MVKRKLLLHKKHALGSPGEVEVMIYLSSTVDFLPSSFISSATVQHNNSYNMLNS